MFKYYIILILQVVSFALTNISIGVSAVFILLTMLILSLINQHKKNKIGRVYKKESIELNISKNKVLRFLKLINTILMISVLVFFVANVYANNKYQVNTLHTLQILLFYSVTCSVSSVYNIYLTNKFIELNKHTIN